MDDNALPFLRIETVPAPRCGKWRTTRSTVTSLLLPKVVYAVMPEKKNWLAVNDYIKVHISTYNKAWYQATSWYQKTIGDTFAWGACIQLVELWSLPGYALGRCLGHVLNAISTTGRQYPGVAFRNAGFLCQDASLILDHCVHFWVVVSQMFGWTYNWRWWPEWQTRFQFRWI